MIIAEWREERAKHTGGHVNATEGNALINARDEDQDHSFDKDIGNTNKFDAEALAKKRALVEEWRRKKMSEQSDIEV